MKQSSLIFHLSALLIVCVWGVTFVSTKMLLISGLNPSSIFFYRFLIAYIILVVISRKEKLFANSIKDELSMLIIGVFGGSFYFLTENTALRYTLSTNVSFILCFAPILTAMLVGIYNKTYKSTFNKSFVSGSLVSIIGVGIVISNGHFILKISPIGDFLCILAALSWAIYTLFITKLDKRYSSIFLTRKVFFYGIITALPIFIKTFSNTDLSVMNQPIVWGNLLFLGLIASFFCYLLWNRVVKEIGALKATNYIYLSPIFTSIASALVLREPFTIISTIGAICIITGVFGASTQFKFLRVFNISYRNKAKQ